MSREMAHKVIVPKKKLCPKMSREMAHKVIVPKKKIMSQSFLNSGTLVILFLFATMGPQLCPAVS
jgi:hypothetical protein